MSERQQHTTHSVCAIITLLMTEAGIREAELARRTGLPQTTINRLLLGVTGDPRANTLKPIADFFGVTIGQLCGFEPLSQIRITGNTQTPKAAWQFIPIIEWAEINGWIFRQSQITPINHKHWIGTERRVSEKTFALNSLSSMEPRFRKGSVLIIDPEVDFKDGHFIVIALDGLTPTVRKVIIDGSQTLLQPFAGTTNSSVRSEGHRFYGTIVESRLNTL